MQARIMEIRPARVQAKYVAIGDMLVVSPIGSDGPRPSQWIGRVTHLIESVDPESCQWRIERPNGEATESAPVPADGFVWVHLPFTETEILTVPAGVEPMDTINLPEGDVMPTE